ncbi:hypothetical protein ACFSC4_29405 [Deinococcus malanensis]|uniref:hypothetical protein n=1 Tax=Deinococcus malanensis TaxID=1706855 RepID=UPI0036419476
MLLTISTIHPPATDLGYLLHKNPARPFTFDLPVGQGHVFYPEATPSAAPSPCWSRWTRWHSRGAGRVRAACRWSRTSTTGRTRRPAS